MVFPCKDGKIQTAREVCTVLRVELIFSLCSGGFPSYKKLEEVDFVDKRFLHKKINKNSVYMWISVC